MPRKHRTTLLVVFILVLGACGRPAVITPESPTAQATPIAQQVKESTQTTATATAALVASPTSQVEATSPAAPIPDSAPLQSLITQALALRSVKISLETHYPNGKTTQCDVEVDEAGNYHLKKTFSGGAPEGYPPALGDPAGMTELYLVSGAAYGPDQSGEIVRAEAAELAGQLERLLRGADGPGLWISVLPQGSLVAGGDEQVGGFQARKYTVQGDIEGARISGAIWVEPGSHALVGADLVVPGALLGSPTQPAQAPLQIKFLVEQAAIAPVTAGGSTPPQAGSAATPSSPSQPGGDDGPVVVSHIPIDPRYAGGLNLAAIDDQVWMLARTGDLLVYDRESEALVKTILLHPERSANPSAISIYLSGSLAYDDQYLWVLLNDSFLPEAPRELFRIDPQTGAFLPVSLPTTDTTCGDDGCGWMALAGSPGKLWVSGEETIWVLDADDPSQVEKIKETGSTGYLAYDGQGMMWGSVQSQHGFMIAIPVDDLEDVTITECIGCSWVLPLDGLVWAGVDSDPGQLLAYEADSFDHDSEPVLTVDLENEVNSVIGGNRIFFDGRYIWDKSALGDTLYYYDPEQGHLAGSLTVYTPEGGEPDPSNSVTSFTYTGQEVWAVGWRAGVFELVRIQVPWGD